MGKLLLSDDQLEWAEEKGVEIGDQGVVHLIDKYRVYAVGNKKGEDGSSLGTLGDTEGKPILALASLNRDEALGAWDACYALQKAGLLSRTCISAPGYEPLDEDGYLKDDS